MDKGLVELLERWGNLPEGASKLVDDNILKDATKQQLQKFAEDVGEQVANEHILKETTFDLENLKWPTTVDVLSAHNEFAGPKQSVFKIPAMMDRMGRLYFRVQDVDPEWLIPGYIIHRTSFDKNQRTAVPVTEQILEMTPLYAGEDVIALQVTTNRLATY